MIHGLEWVRKHMVVIRGCVLIHVIGKVRNHMVGINWNELIHEIGSVRSGIMVVHGSIGCELALFWERFKLELDDGVKKMSH